MSKNHDMKVLTMKTDRDPFNLRNLPMVEPLRDDWPLIETALRERAEQRRTWKATALSLAVAATVTLALGLTLRPPWEATEQSVESSLPDVAQQEFPESMMSTQQGVDSLIVLSQRLESQLRQIRTNAPLTMSSSLVYQVELQDLVAQVDQELSYNPDSAELWAQRVNLLLDLTRLHRNELRRESARMASL